jgi:hypothetical protein
MLTLRSFIKQKEKTCNICYSRIGCVLTSLHSGRGSTQRCGCLANNEWHAYSYEPIDDLITYVKYLKYVNLIVGRVYVIP